MARGGPVNVIEVLRSSQLRHFEQLNVQSQCGLDTLSVLQKLSLEDYFNFLIYFIHKCVFSVWNRYIIPFLCYKSFLWRTPLLKVAMWGPVSCGICFALVDAHQTSTLLFCWSFDSQNHLLFSKCC